MKHVSFTEAELEDALRSLKMNESDEAFEQLTHDESLRSQLLHRIWYVAAAVAAILVIVINPWLDVGQKHSSTETFTMVDENLSQLVRQSIIEQKKAYQQRTLTNDIVSEHLSIIESNSIKP